MTRRGKIARLPRNIRDQLNQRLDDGEQGTRLIEWLNTLPEVRHVLETHFEGLPINDTNLSDWKSGGFLDWQAEQEALALLRESKSDGQELAKVPAAELAAPLTTVLMAHYTAAFYRSNGDATEEPRARVRRLGKSMRDMIRLQRYQLAREQAQIGRDRLELQRQWLELERQKTDDGQRKKFLELAHDARIIDKLTPTMTEAERARRIEEFFLPKEESDLCEPSI